MKKVQLIAYQNIVGILEEDLPKLNGVFCSEVEYFDLSETNDSIMEKLQQKYKSQIDKLYNPILKLKFL